jgi:hypothetical protein
MTMDNTKSWFSLGVATQFIELQPDGMPVVDFVGVVQELDEYATMDDACVAIDSYLAQLGAKATWSDVGPVEKCACCDSDIDTSKPHKVLDLTECVGPFEDDTVQPIDGWYPARFCNSCAPVGVAAVASGLST